MESSDGNESALDSVHLRNGLRTPELVFPSLLSSWFCPSLRVSEMDFLLCFILLRIGEVELRGVACLARAQRGDRVDAKCGY